MNNLIGQAARQLEKIREYLEKVPPSKPVSIEDAWLVLQHDAKNKLQVKGQIERLHGLGKLKRIREGREYFYWARAMEKPGEPVPTQAEPAPKAEARPRDIRDVPEIRVDQDTIIIEHPKCRIIVELK